MRAGKLDKRITFWHSASVSDGHGGSLPNGRVNDLATNANVKPLNQDRTEVGNQTQLIGGYQIYVRYRRDFTPLKTMFIDYKGLTLTITSISQTDEDREMVSIIAMRKK